MTTTAVPSATTPSGADHPNAQRLRANFDAFLRGDLDTVREAATDDATWTNLGSGPLAGTFRGWEQISGMFGRLFEITGGTYTMEVQSVVADDHWAMAVYDATSTIDGRTETHRWVLVDEMGPDGRATSTRLLAFDQAAADRHITG